MTQVLDQLQVDHRNMRQLLRTLEEEIDSYGAGAVPDFDLMRQIIDYVLHYPTLIHHPREDLLFRRLLVRHPAAKGVIGDLVEEHAELAQLAKRFAAALHNVANDVELPRQWFEALARDYVAMTDKHMAIEEQSLFPLLLAKLQDSDWAELDALVAAGNDPLFGSSIEKHFLALHRRVMQARSEDGRSTVGDR